ncbi:MAG: DNA/RNA non-specific endonuclease [Pseudodesulfovibrio sp.]|uniref:DNA/RNA non-specific endonuclease n=1 Tax=Pseudodesulfovibrio sp. TaxID=2035812 RepID=UPI003D13C0BE
MKRILGSLLLILVLSYQAYALSIEKLYLEICPFGLPVGASEENEIVIRDIYALSVNPQTKMADWVVYRIDPKTVNGASVSERKWKADPLLPASIAMRPADYAGLSERGYQRGHQAPLADFKGTDSWYKTNYLSNITPQQGNLNMGAWEQLEDAERQFAQAGEVFVMTGTTYENEQPPLPRTTTPHKVPSGYWKIIVIGYPNAIQAVAFFFTQETPRRRLSKEDAIAIRALEGKAGLDFFKGLPVDLQDRLETEINKDMVGKCVGQ